MKKITGDESKEEAEECYLNTKHVNLEGQFIQLVDTNLTVPSEVMETKKSTVEKFYSIEAKI